MVLFSELTPFSSVLESVEMAEAASFLLTSLLEQSVGPESVAAHPLHFLLSLRAASLKPQAWSLQNCLSTASTGNVMVKRSPPPLGPTWRATSILSISSPRRMQAPEKMGQTRKPQKSITFPLGGTADHLFLLVSGRPSREKGGLKGLLTAPEMGRGPSPCGGRPQPPSLWL